MALLYADVAEAEADADAEVAMEKKKKKTYMRQRCPINASDEKNNDK